MNIYERNIEKCLVNLSRSHVKCPSKSCSNIVQVIGSGIDHVRCRCSHQFCIHCKQEPHFPATCSAYRVYIDEVFRNGDHITDYNAITQIKGRNCISCNNFIEKNGSFFPHFLSFTLKSIFFLRRWLQSYDMSMWCGILLELYKVLERS